MKGIDSTKRYSPTGHSKNPFCVFLFCMGGGTSLIHHLLPSVHKGIFHMCVLSCSVASDSLWPYGPQPARLLRPWDFPGKNTRVSCHSSSRGSPQPRDHLSYPKTLSRGPTGTGTVLEMQVLLAVTLLGAVALCYGLSGPHLGKIVGVEDWHVNEAGTGFLSMLQMLKQHLWQWPNTNFLPVDPQHFSSSLHLKIRHSLYTPRAMQHSIQIPGTASNSIFFSPSQEGHLILV